MLNEDIINKLHTNHRYLFVKEFISKKRIERYYFRANYDKIIGNTLVVKLYKEINTSPPICDSNLSIRTMPINWIKKILSLEDITFGKSKIPPEILRIIDSFIL